MEPVAVDEIYNEAPLLLPSVPVTIDYLLVGLAFSSTPSPFLLGADNPLNVDGFAFEESFDCTEFYYNIGPGRVNDTDRRFEGVSSFSILPSVDILSPSIMFLCTASMCNKPLIHLNK